MSKSIGIIGAGVSGLRCADVLLKQGFKVTIFEARDRIGGRLHQTTLPSRQAVDLGPNWIHGTDHNPVVDLATQTNTPTHSWPEETNIYNSNGDLIPNSTQLSGEFWRIIFEAFKYSEENCATIDPDKSLWDYVVEKGAELAKNGTSEEDVKLTLQIAEMWGAYVGSPITKQTLKFFWLEQCIDGENLFCAGTYQKILAAIAKPTADAELHLSTKVTKIDTQTGTPILHTSDEKSLQFDEVVMTAPLGWLHKNTSVFTPPLPARLLKAISSISYGNLEKVYITFPRPFWHGPASNPNPNSTKPTPGFTQWLHPTYALPPSSPEWNQEAVDLSTLPPPTAHPTLLFYIYGTQASLLAHQWTTLQSQSERTAWLSTYFSPYIQKLPYYNSADKDCIPTNCLATAWTEDEWAGNGSYSCFRTGLMEGDKDVECMREGVPDRGLWFAGEHTAAFEALGTVNGAYSSGESVALRIAEKYGLNV